VCDRNKDKDKQERARKVRPIGDKKKIRFADEDDDEGGKWETVPKRGVPGQMTVQVGECVCMCVCVGESESLRERVRERDRGGGGGRKKMSELPNLSSCILVNLC
jgi:hypothetical protein